MENKALITDPRKRHDFLLLFDVTDGNPNGDPDAGNLPRVDPETMEGIVTDVCLKRKVRNFVDIANGNESNFKIYVQDKGIALNTQHKRAYEDLDIKPTGTKQDREDVRKTRAWMCQNFYDIRMFGAVMTTEVNCGQVRGPMQLTFGRSIDPVVPQDVSITRVAITKEEDAQVVTSEEGTSGGKVTEMGRKSLVPYGLYLSKGFYSPHLGEDTDATSEDLDLFWDALQRMWEVDRSASRGFMAFRGLYIFTHENPLGNAPAHKLFDRLSVERKDGDRVPRKFADYDVTIDEGDLPDGVTLTAKN